MTPSKTSMDPDDGASAQRVASYLKVGVPVGTVVLALAAGAVQGPAVSILVLAGGALVAVIATFWASVRTLFGETPLSGADAYAIGAPRAEEEQKQAVLRALKDLEFERSVGKISEEDYKVLVARYRAEAKRLLRILDTDVLPRRAYAETLVAKRLRREGLLDAAPAVEEGAEEEEDADKDADKDAADSSEETKEESKPQVSSGKKKRGAPVKVWRNKKKSSEALAEVPTEPATAKATPPAEPAAAKATPPAEPAAEAPACSSCSTVNDSDAAFCKKCGARLVGAAEQAASEDVAETKTPDDGAGA